MSEWLYEILSPHVVEIAVMVPPKRTGNKSDIRDAFYLADQLRRGTIDKAVYKAAGSFGPLREMSRVYTKVVKDFVRTQNRIKGLYHSRGISTPGKSVYRPGSRDEWLTKLPPGVRPPALLLYTQYDALKPITQEAKRLLTKVSHEHPIYRILETAPGMAEVRVAQAMAVIVTPHRFRTKRQFWSYAGLGIVMRSSGDWAQRDGGWVRASVNRTRGLNFESNHVLKNIFKGAATTVITKQRSSALGQHYDRLLENGTKPSLAALTIARKIAAIFLAMWKKEEAYDPKKYAR
jgi:transposase